MIPLLIYQQNYEDMAYVLKLIAGVLQDKELTEDDQQKIIYCHKILNNILEKQLYINAQLPS